VKIWQGVQGEGVLGGEGEFSKSTAMDAGDQIKRVGLESMEPNFNDGFPDRGGTDVDLVSLVNARSSFFGHLRSVTQVPEKELGIE
jgi:hypothetical protein